MSADDEMRVGLMQVAEQIKPLREFLAGEVAYFGRQGFTPEQARALAATEFTMIFGMRIAVTPPPEGQ